MNYWNRLPNTRFMKRIRCRNDRVVVRRRSLLLHSIWERHLKQRRCRRWVTRAFLLFLASCFHFETSMQTHRSDLNQLESRLRIIENQNQSKPKLILAKLKCHFPALRVQLAQKSNRGAPGFPPEKAHPVCLRCSKLNFIHTKELE